MFSSTFERLNRSLVDLPMQLTQSTASMSDNSFADLCEASYESLAQQWDIKEKIKQAKAEVASPKPRTNSCVTQKKDDLSYSTHSYEGYH